MNGISKQLKEELEDYARSLEDVEGAEALSSITHHSFRNGCINKEEIDAVYYILTMILPTYQNAYRYTKHTTTKKSKHEQQFKFAEYIDSLNPRHTGMDEEELSEQESELYSLSPLIPNGSNIQRIRDQFKAEVTSILSITKMGKHRINNIIISLNKELTA